MFSDRHEAGEFYEALRQALDQEPSDSGENLLQKLAREDDLTVREVALVQASS
jgi:hypothetical protein